MNEWKVTGPLGVIQWRKTYWTASTQEATDAVTAVLWSGPVELVPHGPVFDDQEQPEEALLAACLRLWPQAKVSGPAPIGSVVPYVGADVIH